MNQSATGKLSTTNGTPPYLSLLAPSLVSRACDVSTAKDTRFTVIQRNFAAWIALYRKSRTQETVIGRLMDERNQNGFSPLDQ